MEFSIQRLEGCEWGKLPIGSPCHTSVSHVAVIGGDVFGLCHAHADSFEMVAKAKNDEDEKLAQEKPVVETEKVNENDSDNGARPEDLSGSEASSIPDAFTL